MLFTTREACLLDDAATSCKTRPLLWMRCPVKMPTAQVTECRSRDSGSSEEREQAWQELAMVSCRGPRAGYPEILRNVTYSGNIQRQSTHRRTGYVGGEARDAAMSRAREKLDLQSGRGRVVDVEEQTPHTSPDAHQWRRRTPPWCLHCLGGAGQQCQAWGRCYQWQCEEGDCPPRGGAAGAGDCQGLQPSSPSAQCSWPGAAPAQ